jgi:filamentous hemagglutinin family protein
MKKKRLKMISITMAAVFLFSSTAWALPQGALVVNGNSTITKPDAQTMHVNQTSDKSIINWQGYSIGAGEKVRYFQPGSNSVSMNRVTGQDPSSIYGQLSANGQVWVINPNGLLVGSGAKINTGSFLGSTLNISDDDFLKGNYTFKQEGILASIINQGSITSQNGGYVALISPSITIEGSIASNLGKAYLATGSEVTLNFSGNDLIGFTIDKEAVEAALGITNKGTISANGGEVILSAKVASDLIKTVVNNEGVIEAKTIAEKDGKIFLLGDMDHNAVKVSGTLDASAPTGGNGGFIETSAARVKVADSAIITTAAPYGKTGTWLIDPHDYTIAASGGDITGALLSSQLGSNNIAILSDSGSKAGNGDINVNDAVSWSSHMLTLTAARDININAVMSASGTSALTMNTGASVAGGTVKVGFAPGVGNGFAGRVDFGNRSGSGFLIINYEDYTVINNVNQLQNMSGDLAGYYALGANIDAKATSCWNKGAGFVPVGDDTTPFKGTFDGLGHTVNNLTINNTTTWYTGLFGYTGSGSTIRNVGLVDGSVTGRYNVGGLAGRNEGVINNSYNTGTVTGTDYVGGLVGMNENGGVISSSHNTGVVNGINDVGGLAGRNDNGNISNSYSTGAVTGTDYVGGLVSVNDKNGVISNSYSTGAVTGTDYVGGLIGATGTGNISDSYSTSAVHGISNVGGLIGWNKGGTISNSYSTGAVTGTDYVGGLMGNNSIGTISNSYSTGEVTGTNYVGGLVGYNWVANISNSYSTGTVNGATYVGGLVGNIQIYEGHSATVNNSYSTGTVNGNLYVGGLVGYNDGGAINDSYNTGIVSGNIFVGGLAGYNGGAITNAYATGAVTGNSHIGGLVGQNNGGAITNAYSTGAVTSAGINAVGGLVGWNSSGSITNAYSTSTVTGTESVGGLVGLNEGTISNSYNTGAVTGTGNNVGGLVGFNNGGAISNAYNAGKVNGANYTGGLVGINWNSGAISNAYNTGAVTGAGLLGGLVGYNVGSIANAYSTGAVTGMEGIGGLVGLNQGVGAISNSYSTGRVTGSAYSGGLVGLNNGGTVTSSFWDMTTSGQATSAGGTGKTTTQMKQLATFAGAGWDIDATGGTGKIWRIYEGSSYPLLRSFLTSDAVTSVNNASKAYDALTYNRVNGATYNSLVNGKHFSVPDIMLSYGGASQGAKDAGGYTLIQED